MAGQAASGSSLYRVPQYIVRICRMIRIICIRMASGGSLYMAPQNAGTCMYECKCVCMYVCMHVCMYACMHVRMHVCMNVSVCV